MNAADILKGLLGALFGAVVGWSASALEMRGQVEAQRVNFLEFKQEVRVEMKEMRALVKELLNRVDARLDFTEQPEGARPERRGR